MNPQKHCTGIAQGLSILVVPPFACLSGIAIGTHDQAWARVQAGNLARISVMSIVLYDDLSGDDITLLAVE
jgi:hypothetical protein